MSRRWGRLCAPSNFPSAGYIVKGVSVRGAFGGGVLVRRPGRLRWCGEGLEPHLRLLEEPGRVSNNSWQET